MRFPINITPISGDVIEGYGDIVDFHIGETPCPTTFVVTFIVDMHFPEPIGGQRRNSVYKYEHVADIELTENHIWEYING